MASSNRATETALGPMVIVAAEQHLPADQRLIADPIVARFLSPATGFAVWLTRFRPVKSLFVGLTESNSPGVWGGILLRKRYIDDKLFEALGDGISQVVNLGAGLDTRAYRLPSPQPVTVYEVDLPENVEAKREALRRVFGRVPDHVDLVPVDFDRDDLAAVLASHGHRLDERTFFIWEGVTQYLTEGGVRGTLEYLGRAAAGSRLAFTYVLADFVDGTNDYGLSRGSQVVRVRGLLWRFGLMPDQVAGLLSEYSWREVEQIGAEEAVARYAMAGRKLAASPIERVVLSEKA